MARIDRADPQRKPLPKPDVRSMLHPLGPVVVFGASNFPLAFSVAGGDTASALAAGNPVIFKAHPAHPGTSELVGTRDCESVREQGSAGRVFSLLFDSGNHVGSHSYSIHSLRLGIHRFHRRGRALMNLAVNRPEPIPFYAEMGSTNPVFVLPGALAARGKEIAAQLHGSFTLGSGQFCTKPGLVFLPGSSNSADFLSEFEDKSRNRLNSRCSPRESGGLSARNAKPKGARDVAVLAEGDQPGADSAFLAGAALFRSDAPNFSRTPISDRNVRAFHSAGPSVRTRRGSARGAKPVRASDRHNSWDRRGPSRLC